MPISDVGIRIKELRKLNKMTLKELSMKANISISFLSDIENGRSNPSLERLKEIADALNTTTSYLLGEEKNDSSAPEPTKEEKDIAKRLEQMRKELEKQQGLMFNGEPASPEAIESILAALEFGMRQAKIINKKYIPKKYRKDDNNEQ